MNKEQLGGRSNCRETVGGREMGWGRRDGLGAERRAGGGEMSWGQRDGWGQRDRLGAERWAGGRGGRMACNGEIGLNLCLSLNFLLQGLDRKIRS